MWFLLTQHLSSSFQLVYPASVDTWPLSSVTWSDLLVCRVRSLMFQNLLTRFLLEAHFIFVLFLISSCGACVPSGECSTKTRTPWRVVLNRASVIQRLELNFREKVNILCSLACLSYSVFHSLLQWTDHITYSMGVHRVVDIIAKLGLQKGFVNRHMTAIIQPILEKGIVDHTITHKLLIEYMTIADKVFSKQKKKKCA